MLNWYQTFQRLRGEYRLIAYDQRHHGMGHTGPFGFRSQRGRSAGRRPSGVGVPIWAATRWAGSSRSSPRPDPPGSGGLVVAATGTGAERNAMEKFTMGGFTRTAPLLNAVPEEIAREDTRGDPQSAHLGVEGVVVGLPGPPSHGDQQVGRFSSTAWLHELDLPVAIVKTMRDIAFPSGSGRDGRSAAAARSSRSRPDTRCVPPIPDVRPPDADRDRLGGLQPALRAHHRSRSPGRPPLCSPIRGIRWSGCDLREHPLQRLPPPTSAPHQAHPPPPGHTRSAVQRADATCANIRSSACRRSALTATSTASSAVSLADGEQRGTGPVHRHPIAPVDLRG